MEAPDIGFGNNAIEFTHTPFAAEGVITFGSVENYEGLEPRGLPPESLYHTTGQYEGQRYLTGPDTGSALYSARIL